MASLGCGRFYKEMGLLDADFRKHIPNAAHVSDTPAHLRNLRLITAFKTAKQGYEAIKNLGIPAKGFLFDVLLAEVNNLTLVTLVAKTI